jgi:hypothetical protein
VAIDGEWQRFTMAGTGIIVPIGAGHVVADVRWLRVDGSIAEVSDRDLNGRIAAIPPGRVTARDLGRMQRR